MQQPLTLKQQTKHLIRNYLQLGIPYAECVQAFKKEFIILVLVAHRGNQCRAARAMGIHRNTLGRALAEYKIDAGLIRSVGEQSAAGPRRKSRRKLQTNAHLGDQMIAQPNAALPPASQPVAVTMQGTAANVTAIVRGDARSM